AALQEGSLTPADRTQCTGEFHLGTATFKDWKEGGHGTVDLQRAIVQSCNIFFYQAGLKVGGVTLVRYARAFGFGAPTGIEPLGGGERRHGGRGPYPRARHRGQDRHRADHREVEGHARPGPRLVRRVRAGEESRGRRGRAGGARRQGWGGRRADRAEDPERDL